MKTKLILFLTLSIFLVACTSSTGPTQGPGDSLLVPVFFQIDITNPSCDYQTIISSEIIKTISGENFIIIGTKMTLADIMELSTSECVIQSFKPTEVQKVIEQLKSEFESERNKKLEELRFNKTLTYKDVTDKDDLKAYLEEKEGPLAPEFISAYQLYVQPKSNAVQDLISEIGTDIQDIYEESLSWVWVSEEYLNGKAEHWFYPEEFLTITPTLSNNPSLGTAASDCSEQANTLVSLLLASGYDIENVRVVLGLVDFGGQIGGHAWAEVYEDGRWFVLEATAGASYSHETNSLTSASTISYDYFKYYPYPSKDIWFYYNNAYFYDLTTDLGNYPSHWEQGSGSWLEDDLKNFKGQAKTN